MPSGVHFLKRDRILSKGFELDATKTIRRAHSPHDSRQMKRDIALRNLVIILNDLVGVRSHFVGRFHPRAAHSTAAPAPDMSDPIPTPGGKTPAHRDLKRLTLVWA